MTLCLMLVAVVLVLTGRRPPGIAAALLAAAVLWLFSTPYVAQRLYQSLEFRFPSLPMAKVPSRDCTILLGGMMGQALPPRVGPDFNESIDRLFTVWHLHRAGKAGTIIIAAGHLPWETVVQPEAEALKDTLIAMGVPADGILIDPLSRNTRENALHVRELMDKAGCSSALLVTSAAHMPRSAALFWRLGMDVTPVPTDFRVFERPLTVFDWLPSVDALQMTTGAMREYIGMFVYRARGWI